MRDRLKNAAWIQMYTYFSHKKSQAKKEIQRNTVLSHKECLLSEPGCTWLPSTRWTTTSSNYLQFWGKKEKSWKPGKPGAERAVTKSSKRFFPPMTREKNIDKLTMYYPEHQKRKTSRQAFVDKTSAHLYCPISKGISLSSSTTSECISSLLKHG